MESARKIHSEKFSSLELNVWRVVNLLMSVFCFLAALVNVNDDDWYLWVPVYLVPAVLCLMIAWNPQITGNTIWSHVCIAHFVLCITYLAYQFTLLLNILGGQLINPLQFEEGRELCGLLIILAWIGFSKFTYIGRPDVMTSNKKLFIGLLWITVTLAVMPLALWSLCFISDWHSHIGHCKGMFA